MTSTKLLGSISIFCLVALFACTTPSRAADGKGKTIHPTAKEGTGISYNFDDTTEGKPVKGLVSDETAGAGKPATWELVKDSKAESQPNAFGITKNENYGHTFNLAIAKESNLKDVDVSVKVKAVAGKEDQGGGPIWRAQDANNYYIARWNPLEDNFRVYCVKNGRRRQLKSAKVQLDTKVYHTIRAVMKGEQIECYLDGKKLLVVKDGTLKKSGMVGLWVKADGQTLFDDLVAVPAK